MEFNSKFQAIQAAHDVLVDPGLRAKYDADRIRAGMLHTYASPSRPTMPPRKPATHFPPPPHRPPPPSATKTHFPPPPSGNRYPPNYSRTESTRAGTSAEDAQAKANDFKAWEQMRHGQGPAPGRTVPPKAPKPSAFKSPREPGNGVPQDSMPKRSSWDQFRESNPGVSRAKSTRVPRNAGFDPGSPVGDEPQARHGSAYFNVSRGDGQQGSRASAHFPPPPSRTGNAARKADAAHSFKGSAGTESHFAKSGRISTPYATAGGEKTYISSPGLGRSSSWRGRRRESEWYDSELNDGDHIRPRATSARPNRKQSTSPHMTNGSHRRPISSSSSSSSSDESISMARDGKSYASASRLRKNRPAMDDNRRSRFNPSVKVEDVEDEDRLYPGKGDGSGGEAWKRHSADHSLRNLGSYYSEGFAQHRTKRESERNQHPSLHNSASKVYTPPHQNSPQRPLNRPRSWHQSSESAEGLNGSRSHARPAAGDQNGKAPMYEPLGNSPSSFTPSSNKWSDQWPFNSPKKPRNSTAALPPYWAIPSSLAPFKKLESRENLHKYFRSFIVGRPNSSNHADDGIPHSFTYGDNGNQDPFQVIPPLKSHSSETINVNFSPTEWHGKFTGNTNEYFAPPPPNRSTARGKNSPSKNRVLHREPPLFPKPAAYDGHETQDTAAKMPPPPKKPTPPTAPAPAAEASSQAPLPAKHDYSSEEWAQHFKPATFKYPPPPPRSPARQLSRKRPMAPRKFPRATYKRSTVPNPASVSAALGNAREDAESASVSESASSKASNASAMDIDPTSTPPSVVHSQGNGDAKSPPKPANTESPSQPAVPPKSTDNSHAEQDPHLNLGDLKKVAPFAPSNEGLTNLNELSSTLPFESRPSNGAVNIPSREPLTLPNPPKAPQVPTNLTQTSWERYIAQMRGYMFEWNAYNTKMLSHFNKRQATVEDTLRPEWMSAVGDGTEKWGFKAYMLGVEEDFRVRQHWDVSWERHRECMKALGQVRERLVGSSVRV